MTKIKLQIKNRFTGALIFEWESEKNTMKETVEQAIKASADLSYANLRSAINSEYAVALTRICPDGDIIGLKKCMNSVIVKLLIPADAKRNNAFGRKCRAEYAKVLEIFGADVAISSHDNKITYTVGETVRPDKWDKDFTNECSSGIHFFITRLEAENYS